MRIDEMNGNPNEMNRMEYAQQEMKSSSWYCSLCNVSCGSNRNLKEHIEGKKHKLKFEVFKAEQMQLNHQ